MRKQPTSHLCLFLVIYWLISFAPISTWAGYWEDVIVPPPIHQTIPVAARAPAWASSEWRVMAVVQLLDDLGRKQAVELNRFAEKYPDIPLGVYSLDRLEGVWPIDFVREVHAENSLSIPFFYIAPPEFIQLYKGFDPGIVRLLPQIYFLNNRNLPVRVLEGFQNLETLEQVLLSIKKPKAPLPVLPPGEPVQGFVNGDFEAWASDHYSPDGWIIWDVSSETVLRSGWRGINGSKALDLVATAQNKYQVVYQTVQSLDAIAGKKLRFSACAQSNTIGKPMAVIGVPHPRIEENVVYAPQSPFVSREGQRIPIRVIASLNFITSTSDWQQSVVELVAPTQAKLMVIMLYLDNPKASGGAARFDDIRLEIMP